MSIEAERNSCPYCSTQLQYCYINLTEKMLICTKENCLFPFDVDDVSPYIIKVNSLVNGNSIAGPLPPLPSLPSLPSSSLLSSSLLSSSSSSSPSSLLKDKFLNLKTQSKPISNLKSIRSKSKSHNSSSTESNSLGLSQIKSNRVLSTRSKNEIPNLSTLESLSNVPSTEFNNLSANSKSINAGSLMTRSIGSNNNESLNPLNEDILEESISNSNNNSTITLKTLGVTLKVDQPNKNKLQQTSSQLSTDTTKNNFSISASDVVAVEKDLTPLFNLNDFPVSVVEGSSADITNPTIGNGLLNVNATNEVDGSNVLTVNPTTGNGLLNVNATNEVDGSNVLTVEEYSQMLFGQSDIDINFDLDNMLTNFNTMDVNMQGNDTNMENVENMDLDEFLGTIDSLESSKLSGNDMNLDFDSFMASLDGSFAGVEIPNDMSGNNLNVDLNSMPVNTNGMNGIQNNNIENGHLDNCLEVVNGSNNETNENHNTIVDLTFGSVSGQNGSYHENVGKTKNGVNGLNNHSMLVDLTLGNVNGQNGYHENVGKTKNGINGLNNHSTSVDLTSGNLVNGQNGYHESIEKTKNGVNGLVEDEGKNVVGKTINGDSVTLVT